MRTFRNSIATLVLLLPVLCSAAETADQVVADILTKAKNLTTYSGDTETNMNMGAMLMDITGQVKGKDKMMHMATTMDMMQQKIAMTMILDKSNIMWMDMDMMGMKQVMKMDMTKMAAMQEEMMGMMPLGGLGGGMGGMQGDPREMIEQMKKTMDLAYAGREDLNGESVYVFDATMKAEVMEKMQAAMADSPAAAMGMDIANMMGSTKMKFGVADGFPRSMEMKDKAGTVWMTQTYKNLKFNEPMDDALFTYTPAEGVVVMDMTEMMNAEEEAAEAEEPATTEQP